MHIRQFDPAADVSSLQSCRQIVEACASADEPDRPLRSPAAFAAWWSHGLGGDPRTAWLATDADGRTVGCYLLMLPERANTTTATCALYVAPGARRAGYGAELLAPLR